MSTPEVFFRETIDLGRYSNSVSRKFVSTYNDIIVAAAKKLRQIDLRQQAAAEGVIVAPQTRKRLRAIIAQSKTSLNTWAKTTTKEMTEELQGLALLQTDFIKNELQKVTASGDIPINSVAVSPKYAESFVTTDPTQVNIFTSKQFTEDDFVKFGAGKFELTARQGASITLPNGQTVEKAFRGIAERQQDALARHIRQGVFSGESTQQIARRMIGRLDFGQKGNVRQIAAAGGEITKLANYQVKTIVRTSINQVQNQASQAVYAANKKVSPRYEYVATLDSRTSAICMRLDGQEFEYNKGPTPPQHFNCRSTTVPVVDFDRLQKKYPNLEKPPATQFDTRPSATGRVPQGTTYGNWLLNQDKKLQVKTLGNEQKVRYFERLAKKEGSGQKAIRKMVREDGSERSLKDLQRLYGKPSDITIKIPKLKPVTKPTVTITNQDKLEQTLKAARAAERKAKAELKAIKAKDPLQPNIAQLQGINKNNKIQPKDVNDAFNMMDDMEGLAGANAKKLRQFTEQRECFCSWTSGAEIKGRTYDIVNEKTKYLKENAQFRKSLQMAKDRGIKNVKDNAPAFDPITRELNRTNIERTKVGLSHITEILDDGLGSSSAWGHGKFRVYATTGRTDAYGFTFQGANHICMKSKPYYRKLKDLKKIKEKVKESVELAAKGTPQRTADQGLYRLGYTKAELKKSILDRKSTVLAEDAWLTTYVHEMGHQIHYVAGRPAMAGTQWIPSRYGGSNYMEQFAETFVQYIFDPVSLKKVSPDAYKWVDDTVAAALKVPI